MGKGQRDRWRVQRKQLRTANEPDPPSGVWVVLSQQTQQRVNGDLWGAEAGDPEGLGRQMKGLGGSRDPPLTGRALRTAGSESGGALWGLGLWDLGLRGPA